MRCPARPAYIPRKARVIQKRGNSALAAHSLPCASAESGQPVILENRPCSQGPLVDKTYLQGTCNIVHQRRRSIHSWIGPRQSRSVTKGITSFASPTKTVCNHRAGDQSHHRAWLRRCLFRKSITVMPPHTSGARSQSQDDRATPSEDARPPCLSRLSAVHISPDLFHYRLGGQRYRRTLPLRTLDKGRHARS